MKLTEKDIKNISDVVTKLNNGHTTLKEYAPIMVFQNNGDVEKVKKGLDVLEKKINQIKEANGYKEMKKVLKIKKIVKEDE